MSQMDSKCKK